jgi:CHAT domain-containing protein
LCTQIFDAIPDGRQAWLSPQGKLHYIPFQLASRQESRKTLPLVPALSIIEVLKPAMPLADAKNFLVCGDPLGDLPFARAEARLIGRRVGAIIATGSDCHAEFLQTSCSNSNIGVIHFACHGRFDSGHAERTGFILSATDDERLPGTSNARLFSADDIARLSLSKATVVLSACSSGVQVIRGGDEPTGIVGAFLRAGASTILAAQWPISDLSAMIFMVDLYRKIASASFNGDLDSAVDAAAQRLRRMTAEAVFTEGFQLSSDLRREQAVDDAVTVATGCVNTGLLAIGQSDLASRAIAIQAEWRSATDPDVDGTLHQLKILIPTSRARHTATPFEHPVHWAGYIVVGGGGVLSGSP